jgi:hypothetical protein
VWLAVAAYAQGALQIAEQSPSLCQPAAESSGAFVVSQRDFSTRDLCTDSFGRIDAGVRYAVTFDVVDPWFDSGVAASPSGIDRSDYPFLLGYVTTPFLRALDARILQPVMKVTSTNHVLGVGVRSVYLAPLAVQRAGDGSRYQGEFVSPASGELYLFANDAMLPVFGRNADYFYRRSGGTRTAGNRGTACVTVTRIDHARRASVIPPPGPICNQAQGRDGTHEDGV